MSSYDPPRILLGVNEWTPPLAKKASQCSKVLFLGETLARRVLVPAKSKNMVCDAVTSQTSISRNLIQKIMRETLLYADLFLDDNSKHLSED